MAANLRTAGFSEFTGGLNTALDSDDKKNNELDDALNVRPSRTGNMNVRGGMNEKLKRDSGTFPNGFSGQLQATQADGTTRTIISYHDSGNDKFQEWDGSSLTSLSKDGGVEDSTNGERYRWVFFNDLWIGVNRDTAKGKPVKWEGPGNNVKLLSTQPNDSGLANGSKRPIDVAVWSRRVVMIQEDGVYVSDIEDPETWFQGDSALIQLKGASGGKESPTTLATFQEKLFIFKNNSIWTIDPQSGVSNDWRVELVTDQVGCDAPFSIVNTGQNLFWVYKKEVRSLSDIPALSREQISRPVSWKVHNDFFEDLATSESEEITGAYNPDTDEYLLSAPIGSSQTTNNRVMVLNLFYTSSNGSPSWWVFEYGRNLRSFWHDFSSTPTLHATDYEGAIYQLESGSQDRTEDSGSMVDSNYTKRFLTKSFTLGDVGQNMVLREVGVDVALDSTDDWSIVVHMNEAGRKTVKRFNHTKGSLVWDEGNWDEEDWFGSGFGRTRLLPHKITRDAQVELFTEGKTAELGLTKIWLKVEPSDTDIQREQSEGEAVS